MKVLLWTTDDWLATSPMFHEAFANRPLAVMIGVVVPTSTILLNASETLVPAARVPLAAFGFSMATENFSDGPVRPMLTALTSAELTVTVRADLLEYEHRIRVRYAITAADGTLTTRAETTQVAVDLATRELRFDTPDFLLDAIRRMTGETP